MSPESSANKEKRFEIFLLLVYLLKDLKKT